MRFLVSAEKKNLSYNYNISISPNTYSKDNHIATLKSNFLGTEFNLFNGNDALASITYELNILGFRGPRKIKVFIPGLDENNSIIGISIQKESLAQKFKNNKSIKVYCNKCPIWSESINY